MEALIEKAPVVIALIFLNYWIMEWLKEALPVKEIFKQPISLIVGTVISTVVLYNYNFRPIDLGIPNSVILDYFLQGALLASVTGVFYDKLFRRENRLEGFDFGH
jgi:hypothetical protein